MNDETKLYSLVEVSKLGLGLLPISVPTLRRLIKQNLIPYRRIGRNRVYMTKLDIENYINNSYVPMVEGGKK